MTKSIRGRHQRGAGGREGVHCTRTNTVGKLEERSVTSERGPVGICRVPFLRGLWVRGRVVVTGLYLSRLTVLCTVHALCVATLVRAIVLQVFLVAQECGFCLMATRVCR